MRKILKSLTTKKAQSIMEYAILLAVVVSAITAMALYVRRAVQANIRVIEKEINVETNETE